MWDTIIYLVGCVGCMVTGYMFGNDHGFTEGYNRCLKDQEKE